MDVTAPDIWPFLHREREVAAVVAGATGPAALAGVAGGPGIGKSALLRSVGQRLSTIGWTVVRLNGNGAAPATLAEATLAALTKPVDGPAGRAGQTPFEAARAGLLERLERGRVVLLVDDAHRLDLLSAALVEWAAGHTAAAVVLAAESGGPLPPPLARLRRARPDLWVALEPLTPPAVAELLLQVFGATVDGVSTAELVASTGGNPQHLRELVSAGRQSGAFTQRYGVWLLRWQDVRLSTLDDVVVRATARLGQPGHAALELLACGEPLPVGVLTRLVAPRWLDLLERRGLISTSRPPEVARVSPALLGQALRTGLPALRRREIYARLATATAGRDEVELSRRATWAVRGGVGIDAESLVRAGWREARDFRLDSAESLARTAIAADGGWPARYLLACILRQRRSETAGAAVAGAVRHAGSAVQRSQAAVIGVESLYWNTGQRDAALGSAAQLPEDSADAAALRAVLAFFDGRLAETLGTARPLLDLDRWSRRKSETEALARLRRVAVFAAVAAGRAGEALRWAESGLAEPGWTAGAASPAGEAASQDGGGDPEEPNEPGAWRRRWLHWGHCNALIALGQLADAGDLAGAGYEDGVRLRLSELAGGWALAAGQVAHARGRLAVAEQRFREAAALLSEHDPLRFTSVCLTHVAMVLAQRGDPEGGEAVLAEAATQRGPSQVWDAAATLAAGWIAHARGERSRAVDLATEAGDLAAAGGDLNGELPARHAIARFGEPQRAMARLGLLAGDLDGPWAALAHRHAGALVAQDAGGLQAVAGDYGTLGADLLAAEAGRAAAVAHRAAGRVGSAIAALAGASARLSRCGDPPLSTLPPAQASPLTRREEEVIALATAGHTSRSIADLLGLSVRTVDNHLGSAYRKLGTTGRRALAGSPGTRPDRPR